MSAVAQTTLMDHLRELRGRLVWSVGVIAIGAGAAYVFRAAIIAFLRRPLGESLYYTSPTGSFEFVTQVCFVVGLIVALPVLIYNALRFVEPALPRRLKRRHLTLVVCLSFTLALAGAAFGYYISLPGALAFFKSVGTSQLQPLISTDQYFGFVTAYLATFAVIFQLPLILLLIDRIKPIGPSRLRKWRKFVIVGAFGVALITPSAPDPFSQVLLALPLIVLYEVTILCLVVRHRRLRSRLSQPEVRAESIALPDPSSAGVPEVFPSMLLGPPFYHPRSKPSSGALTAQKIAEGGILDLRDHSVPALREAPVGPLLDLRGAG